MIVELATAFELRTLVVIGIVAQRIIQNKIEAEAPVMDIAEYISVKIGVRIANNHLVVGIDFLAVVPVVNKNHIAGTKIYFGAGFAQNI